MFAEHKLIEQSNQAGQVLWVDKRYCKASQKKSYEKRKYNLTKKLFILLMKALYFKVTNNYQSEMMILNRKYYFKRKYFDKRKN